MLRRDAQAHYNPLVPHRPAVVLIAAEELAIPSNLVFGRATGDEGGGSQAPCPLSSTVMRRGHEGCEVVYHVVTLGVLRQ